MVDDDFVAAVGTERCLHCLGYGSTCFYVPYHGTVFGFVAKRERERAIKSDVLFKALRGETWV